MRRWKARLSVGNGFRLDGDADPLTNVRFADDLILFAKSLSEIEDMTNLLVGEFAKAGLVANGAKTKLLTTDAAVTSGHIPVLVDIGGMFVEVIKSGSSHKYLGKSLPGDLSRRGQRNLDHRLSCAWFRFHELQHTLCNRKIPVHLRLKLFDSVVSPTVLYSLSTTPLTATQCERLDGVQRKMLRRIVGWVRIDDEGWDVTGHRMKQRLQLALAKHPVATWSEVRSRHTRKLIGKLISNKAPTLACRVYRWALCPSLPGYVRYRRPGRPSCRWTG